MLLLTLYTNRSHRTVGARAAGALALLLAATLLPGCQQQVTEVAGPGGGPPVDTTGTGTVQRLTLTVTVQTEPADSGVARQLGLTGGVLGEAEVVARRDGSSDQATGRTDAQGVVRFPNLLPGRWSVSASRFLTDADRQQLAPEDRDVTAWAGGFNGQVNLSASIPLSVVAGRRGSLVISEWFAYAPPTATYAGHPWGQYVEIYNNSDTTIYLDGKIFGKMVENVVFDSPTFPCAQTAGMRMTTRGIWTRTAARFPGSGRDNPLAPGAAVIIATDAVDHRAYNPSLLDLSGADYEFVVTAGDIDNPSSRNLVPITSIGGTEGHGPDFYVSALLFIADASPDAAIKDSMFAGTAAIKLVPQILDVVAQEYQSQFPGTPPMCRPLVARQFESQPGRILNGTLPSSMARRTIGRSALGHPLLQRTRSSDRDLDLAPASPRSAN